MAVFGSSGSSTNVSSQFLNQYKTTAIPNLTAVTHFLAEFLLRFKKSFQNVAHPQPPTPPHLWFILAGCMHVDPR